MKFLIKLQEKLEESDLDSIWRAALKAALKLTEVREFKEGGDIYNVSVPLSSSLGNIIRRGGGREGGRERERKEGRKEDSSHCLSLGHISAVLTEKHEAIKAELPSSPQLEFLKTAPTALNYVSIGEW